MGERRPEQRERGWAETGRVSKPWSAVKERGTQSSGGGGARKMVTRPKDMSGYSGGTGDKVTQTSPERCGGLIMVSHLILEDGEARWSFELGRSVI